MAREKTFEELMRAAGVVPLEESGPQFRAADSDAIAPSSQPGSRPTDESSDSSEQCDYLRIDGQGRVVLPPDDAAVIEMLAEKVEAGVLLEQIVNWPGGYGSFPRWRTVLPCWWRSARARRGQRTPSEYDTRAARLFRNRLLGELPKGGR